MNQVLKQQDVTLGVWGDEMRLSLRASGVAVLSLDAGSVNALSNRVIDYFSAALDFIASEPSIKAVIFSSEKKNIFIAGADIREIVKIDVLAEANALSAKGHSVLKKVTELKIPTVAAIDGICLGGGLELVLCCDKRVATNNIKTKIGLPEVNIGLIPGLGGTQRLPRMIGVKPAVELILSGEPLDAELALAAGIVDKIVVSNLLDASEEVALEMIATKFDRSIHAQEREKSAEEKDGGYEKRLSILKMSDRMIRIRTRGLVPAPRRAIEVIEYGLVNGLEAGIKREIEVFAELAVSAMAKNMINFYISQEMAVQTALRTMENADRVTTCGIIGSGTMGLEIADIALQKGINVLVKGSSPEKSASAVQWLNKRAESRLDAKSADEAIVPASVEAADLNDDLRPAQLIIEAVPEDTDLKNKVIFEVARAVPAGCIIASNTSSFAISNLSQFSNKPERVLGLHFFNPVDRMPLVEVVTHERTDAEVLKTAIAFAAQLGKIPVTVKDSPGFLVNRLLTHFMAEAARLCDDGIPLNWVDDTATQFGMPIGPFCLFDELGWELSSRVCHLMHEKFGQRYLPPIMLNNIMPYGLRGKDGGGLYLWDDKGKRLDENVEFLAKVNITVSKEKPDEATTTLIRDRLFLPMVDEAGRCLEEKIVRKARDIDLALVLGVAFPRFRGGLLRWADDLGLDYVVDRLNEIYTKYKPAREVGGYLMNLKKEGRRFYGFSNN